ncbi:MAG: hypothetical protein ACYSSP_10750 [Planctomycetota bacterium]
MINSKSFLMWGERGLITTFFADMYQINNLSIITKFLQMMQFQKPPAESDAVPISTAFIIEPDFGNMGFGHPDIIIKIQYEDYAVNVIGEAKRTTFEKACWESSRRTDKGFNSSLNGQLELNYRLGIALSEYKDGDRELIEPEWILDTPYYNDSKDWRRRLVNPNVLKEVVSLIGGEKFDRYYYLVITTDDKNPLSVVKETYCPQLFNKPASSGTSVDCWSEYNKRFGWLNYTKMKEFIESLQNQLPIGSLFLPTYKFNEKNMGQQSYQGGLAGETKRGSKGSCLIYAPEINSETFLHFSWQNESSALRDYSQSETMNPVPDYSFRTSEVEQKLERKDPIPKRKPYTDVPYWHRKIIEFNQKYLKNG